VVFAFCLLLVLSNTHVHAAQDKPSKEARTLFLVARPELGDPLFKESVVLMFPPSVVSAEGLVIGLIVNRPAQVALSEIFPKDDALKNRTETVYFGGPVDVLTPGVVFRSKKVVKHAALLFNDIYVSFDPDFVKELLKSPEKTPDLRLFVGRSQWLPGQLQNEMDKRAWYSVRAETNLIFGASPKSLWRNLFDRVVPPNVAGLSEVRPSIFPRISRLVCGNRRVAPVLLGAFFPSGSLNISFQGGDHPLFDKLRFETRYLSILPSLLFKRLVSLSIRVKSTMNKIVGGAFPA
jgi:putative transcriptional regulator